jgi:hypothetical protein
MPSTALRRHRPSIMTARQANTKHPRYTATTPVQQQAVRRANDPQRRGRLRVTWGLGSSGWWRWGGGVSPNNRDVNKNAHTALAARSA